jgi:hypothetical protein
MQAFLTNQVSTLFFLSPSFSLQNFIFHLNQGKYPGEHNNSNNTRARIYWEHGQSSVTGINAASITTMISVSSETTPFNSQKH